MSSPAAAVEQQSTASETLNSQEITDIMAVPDVAQLPGLEKPWASFCHELLFPALTNIYPSF